MPQEIDNDKIILLRFSSQNRQAHGQTPEQQQYFPFYKVYIKFGLNTAVFANHKHCQYRLMLCPRS